jgi:Glyoxalase/Bleomycin resistance protein/Dioxygenase superfamily
MIEVPMAYHWAIVVEDFDTSAESLGRDLGYTFAESIVSSRPFLNSANGQADICRLRVAYSRQGPPFLELIQILAPGPAFTYADIGRIHHVGLWCDDLAAAENDLAVSGRPYFQIQTDGGELFGLLSERSTDFGARIEYSPSTARPAIEAWASTGRSPTQQITR